MKNATVCLVLLLCMNTYAQSGRRGDKRSASSGAAPTDTKRSEQSSDAEQNRPATIKLLVAIEHTKKRLSTEDAIYGSFGKRLSEFREVAAKPVGELKKDQAVQLSKQQVDSYVIVVHFTIDSNQDGRTMLNSQNLQVDCYGYAPKTGERKINERVYYQTGTGVLKNSTWPVGPAVKLTVEDAAAWLADELRTDLITFLNSQQLPSKRP